MRTLKKNEQTLYYAQYVGNQVAISDENLFELENGDSLLTENSEPMLADVSETLDIDGESYILSESAEEVYSLPVKFKANISFDSGETQLAEYGLNPSDYHAIINAPKGKFPFTEQTLIWHKSVPVIDRKTRRVRPETADYRVKAIKTSLNEERFILKKRVDD